MSNDTINTSTDSIFNDLETIMDSEIVTPLIARLDYETPITVNALAKVSGLSQTALTLALVELGGRVGVKDGGLVRLPEPEPVTEKAKAVGPRGPTAKVAPRLEACKAAFIEMAGRPEGVTAKELLTAGGDSYVYTDILLVARNLTESGTITESRKGRKATWNLTTSE